ncbi:hypothetical protein Dimus_015004 [Dionaea muscipula]
MLLLHYTVALDYHANAPLLNAQPFKPEEFIQGSNNGLPPWATTMVIHQAPRTCIPKGGQHPSSTSSSSSSDIEVEVKRPKTIQSQCAKA